MAELSVLFVLSCDRHRQRHAPRSPAGESGEAPGSGVELPLVGFFLIAPILFVISHAYVLVHFVLLAAKANRYHQELRAQVADPALREKFRSRMPSNIFVQLVAGPRDMRRGAFGWILQIEA